MNAPVKLADDTAASRTIRAMIVDDSAAMRAVLANILAADGDIEVVGSAPDPFIARDMIKRLDPDVLTLDVEMPGMDGLSFLEKIMRLRPMPVVMCSTLTAHGAEVTIEALRLGAVECISKPTGQADDLLAYGHSIRKIVKAAAGASTRTGMLGANHTAVKPQEGGDFREDALIAIGSSTGGVEALFSILPAFPADCPPVLIVQHMPEGFTAGFAKRLDNSCAATVVEAEDAMPIRPGRIYIAPGGSRHMTILGGPRGTIRLKPGPAVTGHSPSVDVLFHSVAKQCPPTAAVGTILTGMGEDGADGLRTMRQAGAATFGQSAESCVIYGMPRAAMERGAVERELSLSALPVPMLAACRTN